MAKKKLSNEMLKSWVILLVFHQCFKLSREEFENKVNNLKIDNELIPLWERKAILKHFKTQIYPVSKEVALWMAKNLRREYDDLSGINFYDRYKELQKLNINQK